MTEKPTPTCPNCGNRKAIVQIADTFKCGRCGGLFDADPSEGGSHYDDPTKRLDKQEQQRQRKIERMNKRGKR